MAKPAAPSHPSYRLRKTQRVQQLMLAPGLRLIKASLWTGGNKTCSHRKGLSVLVCEEVRLYLRWLQGPTGLTWECQAA